MSDGSTSIKRGNYFPNLGSNKPTELEVIRYLFKKLCWVKFTTSNTSISGGELIDALKAYLLSREEELIKQEKTHE